MNSSDELQDLSPAMPTDSFGGDHVSFGVTIPKQKRLEILDEDEWESFVEEWATSLNDEYPYVKRHSGAGDKGLDVVGLLVSEQLSDGYDNFQCKHYDHPLAPSEVWIELGKLAFYTWRGDYPVPRRYRFAAPRGLGTKLHKLLGNADNLKAELKKQWEKHCQDQIVSGTPIILEGELLNHLDALDFSIFGSVTGAELIEGHSKTSFHAVRFGGGFSRQHFDLLDFRLGRLNNRRDICVTRFVVPLIGGKRAAKRTRCSIQVDEQRSAFLHAPQALYVCAIVEPKQ